MRLHPGMDQLLRFAAQERSGLTDGHLASCADCRADVGWIRDVRSTLATAPAPWAPEGAWLAVRDRIEHGDTVLLPPEPFVRVGSGRRSAWRLAGAALVVLFAGAAYALPGSPVRTWVARAIGAVPDPAPAAPVSPSNAPHTADPPPATFIVPPAGGQVLVAVAAPGPDLRIRLRWIDRGGLEVRAVGQAALARFRSGPGRITISDAAGGEIVLVVPRDVRRVELTVDGMSYLVQERGAVTITAPAADTIGAEVVLTLPRPTTR